MANRGDTAGISSLDSRAKNKRLKNIAKALAVEPYGRGGDAENMRIRNRGDDLAPHAGDGVVRLIDDQQVESQPIEAANKGRDDRDLHRRSGVSR